MRAAGHAVVTVDDSSFNAGDALPAALGGFAAVICTHGLLHGSLPAIQRSLDSLADRLDGGGLFYATFGSVRDARFGQGRRIGPATFAPLDGDELGVEHTYFTRAALESLLKPRFEIEWLRECDVDTIAGSWAHRERSLSKAVHWFVVARVPMRSCIGLDALA